MTATKHARLVTFRQRLQRKLVLVKQGRIENQKIGAMFRRIYLFGDITWAELNLELCQIPNFEGSREYLFFRRQWRAIDGSQLAQNALINGSTWNATYRLAVDLSKGGKAVMWADYTRMINRAIKLVTLKPTTKLKPTTVVMSYLMEFIKRTSFSK
jgi:hypothetical protein